MIKTGLVSVTFRKLSPREIIDMVAKAGLSGIEWGGDIHVPHGNIGLAREVGRMTVDAGLKVAAYGSYYHVGCEEQEGVPFEKVMETALELKAPVIRVWAGDRGSGEADEVWWEKVVKETRRISGMAKDTDIAISFEYHGNTLTDTGESAVRLMREAGGGNISCYWQPPTGLDFDGQMEGLRKITPWLSNIHAFWWDLYERLPLLDGADTWRRFIAIVRALEGEHFCMLEFVRGDSVEQFREDAAALKQIIL